MEKTLNMIEYFFKDNQARFSNDTVRGYGIALRQFFNFTQKQYDQIKRGDIRKWYASLDNEGLMPRTIRIKLGALSTFYKYLLEENIIKKNPITGIELPKIDDSLPVYLDKRQLAQLMELVKDNQRERTIIEMLYATGVRISELINIKKSDIKWDTRQIWITKGKGNKERFVLFTPECAERLKRYLDSIDNDSPYIFPNKWGVPLSRSWIEQLFRGYSEQLGFKVTPHLLRHTFAAHLSEKGMPLSYIQDLLGHTNINTTRVYTRLSNAARKKQYDSFQ